MAIDLPEQIGRYRLQAVIGTGGFATVYRAVDERLDATVAIKVLAENHSHDPDLRERFLREGQVLRRIDGPHVVTVHDLGETDRGQPYLVLDHADRGNLSERAASRRTAGWRPEITDLLYVAEAVADALAAVHASQLVHRDVAPRNLLLRSARVAGTRSGCGLVDADERLLLADLGLSKDLATASGLTVGGGTAGYTPPEQRTAPAKVDAAADVWAASALIVWLLLDRPPDDEGHWQRQLAGAGWPEGLVGSLVRGLAWESADRHESAPAWFAAIRETVLPTTVMTGPASAPVADPAAPVGVAQVPPGPGTTWPDGPSASFGPGPVGHPTLLSPPGPPSAAPPRHWAWWIVAAGLGVILGAGGVLLVRGSDDPPRSLVQTEEELAEGQVRVEATKGQHSVAIVGPAEADVDESAVFAAETSDGVYTFMWIGPDGVVHEDEDELTVDASSSGRATVTLVGIGDDGGTVMAVHEVDVLETEIL